LRRLNVMPIVYKRNGDQKKLSPLPWNYLFNWYPNIDCVAFGGRGLFWGKNNRLFKKTTETIQQRMLTRPRHLIVGGPCRPTLDVVIAFLDYDYILHIINFPILYINLFMINIINSFKHGLCIF
jgi:hypothetical protein